MEDVLRTTAYLAVLFGTIGWMFTLAYIKCRMKKTTEKVVVSIAALFLGAALGAGLVGLLIAKIG